jgi:hypothetical protein
MLRQLRFAYTYARCYMLHWHTWSEWSVAYVEWFYTYGTIHERGVTYGPKQQRHCTRCHLIETSSSAHNE